MPSAFINYRREETSGYAGRLYGDLKETLGQDTVFMDLNIEPGEDFTEVINDRVASCDVQLVIIGKQWAKLKDDGDQLRIDNPDDFVRLEIGAALKRQIRVIPILVQGATLPKRDQLPDDLKGLVSRQAFEISDSRWDHDVTQLTDVVKKIFATQAARARQAPAAASAAPSTERPPSAVSSPPVEVKPQVHDVPIIPPAPPPVAVTRASLLEPATESDRRAEGVRTQANPVRFYVAPALATIVVIGFQYFAVVSEWRGLDEVGITLLLVIGIAALFCGPLSLVPYGLESRVAVAATWGLSALAAAHLLPYLYYFYGPLPLIFIVLLSYALFVAVAYLSVVKGHNAP